MPFKRLYKVFVTSVITMCAVGSTRCAPVNAVPTPVEAYPQTPISTVTPELVTPMIYAPAPTSIWDVPSAISLTDTCHFVVDGLYAMKKDLGLPDHFLSDNPIRQKEDFDPNQYFEVFTHLIMSSDYTLDYIYFMDEVGRRPLMYSRKIGQNSFKTYQEIRDYYGNTKEPWYSETYFLNQVQIDKSPESYFEYIILAMLGNQFYISDQRVLDAKILCDHSDLRYLGDKIKVSEDVVGVIDFRPTVVVDETTVTVRFISFTTWMGSFFENIVVFNKENPLQLLDKFSLQYIIQ